MSPSPVSMRFRIFAADDGLDGKLRVARFDPDTGEKSLVHAVTGEPFPRPFNGVVLDMDEAPPRAVIGMSIVDEAGPFIERVNERPVFKPAGPPDKPWSQTHTFIHADELIFHLDSGTLRYRVVRQPDKYDDETGEPSDNAGDPTTHVVWTYELELIEES